MVSCACSIRTGTTEHHRSDSAAAQCFLRMAAHQRSDVTSCGPLDGGAAMRNEPWVWRPKVGDAGTSGAGAVPLRSAQMMGQQQQNQKKEEKMKMQEEVFGRRRKRRRRRRRIAHDSFLPVGSLQSSAPACHPPPPAPSPPISPPQPPA